LSLSESVVLQNDVDLVCSYSLSNVSSAQLNVSRDGVLVFSDNVSGSGQKTYSKSHKGNYSFDLVSADLDKKVDVTVPDYPSTLDLSGLNFDFNKFSSTSVTLPKPIDKNPEDNPVSIVSVKSSDSLRVSPSLNGNVLNLLSKYDAPGLYSLEFGLKNASNTVDKVVVSGQVINVKIDYLSRPNKSDLNWYGSGDLNLDKVVDAKDLDILKSIVSGTYVNPNSNDKWLLFRADLNGDGKVDDADSNVMQNKLSGVIAYLPSDYDKSSISEKKDWITKMTAHYYKTAIKYVDFGGDCNQYTDGFMIAFGGVKPSDIPKYKEVFNYDFTNNCLYNLRALELGMDFDDIPNSAGHMMICFALDKITDWNNIFPVEPQFGAVNVQPGQLFFKGINTRAYISGPPVTGVAQHPITGKKYLGMFTYVNYNIVNNVSSVSWTYPDLAKK